jgi:hypothetical protein
MAGGTGQQPDWRRCHRTEKERAVSAGGGQAELVQGIYTHMLTEPTHHTVQEKGQILLPCCALGQEGTRAVSQGPRESVEEGKVGNSPRNQWLTGAFPEICWKRQWPWKRQGWSGKRR